MIRQVIVAVFLLTCLKSFSQPVCGRNLYSIRLVQGNDTLPVPDSGKVVIHLKRQPFKFLFTLKESKFVFFIASQSSKYYNTPMDSTFPDCMMFCGGSVGAGTLFNPDKEICVYGFSQGISCWYYDSASDHRFDGPASMSDSALKVERTIEKVYDYKGSKKYIPLNKLGAGQYVYMVFMDMEHEKCNQCEAMPGDKMWRRYVKLVFD